jgi:hypothetical protein
MVVIMQDPDGQQVVARELDPFAVCLLAVNFVYGLLCTISFSDFASRALRNYPGIGGQLFSGLLVVGTITALIGMAHKSMLGLRLELAALSFLAVLGLAYITWTLFSVGKAGTGFMLYLGVLLVIPSAWRSWKIKRRTRKLRSKGQT